MLLPVCLIRLVVRLIRLLLCLNPPGSCLNLPLSCLNTVGFVSQQASLCLIDASASRLWLRCVSNGLPCVSSRDGGTVAGQERAGEV
jgi:hypothetical protein